jgi:hypothetical protein
MMAGETTYRDLDIALHQPPETCLCGGAGHCQERCSTSLCSGAIGGSPPTDDCQACWGEAVASAACAPTVNACTRDNCPAFVACIKGCE